MSMTAYNILECRRNTTKQNRASRARMSRGARASRPSRESETAALDARRTHVPLPLASDVLMMMYIETHARRAKGNPVPIPEPGSGTAYNSGPRKSVRRGNPK